MTTIAPSKVYAQVKAAVKAGATVTAEDLETANEYAKKSRRGQIKDAKLARATKLAGVMCPGDDKDNHDGEVDEETGVEGRKAVVSALVDGVEVGLCMKHYIRQYRKDPANRERANKASRDYAARQKALKA